MRSFIRALVLLLAFAPLIAAAQAPPSPATPPAQSAPQPAPKGEARDPKACAPTPNSTRDMTKDADKGTVGQGAPLSDRLAQTDGVICPPANVDPEIRAPTPNTDANRMPVIPPPGSPGGDPSARPK